jgi:hypothetical protein
MDTAFLTVNILPATTTTAASAGNNLLMEQAPLAVSASAPQWKWGKATGIVFPNPARNRVTLSVNSPYIGKAALHIYSLQGALLMTEVFDKSTVVYSRELQLGGLAAGTYIVQVWQGTTPLFSQRLSKSD